MTKKLRILHLSDFHLNQDTLKDWNLYLKDALIDKVKASPNGHNIDLVAFTGDILDRGGTAFQNEKEAFSLADKNVFQPLLDSLSLGRDRFFIVPGNHDIQREKDLERDELGLRSYFEKDQKNIRKFINESEDAFDGIKRIQAYKEFENDFYSNVNLSLIGKFSSSFIVELGKKTVGVVCINSAWRCYDNSDHGRIIVGMDVLAKHSKRLENCDLKIALMHHPLDSISHMERDVISSHLSSQFDLMLFGHSHRTFTSITSGFTGTIFLNMAPSGLNNIYTKDRDYSNGFTIIEIDEDRICAEYWRFNLEKREFVLNTDAGQKSTGRLCQDRPGKNVASKIGTFRSLVEDIKENHFQEMDDHLIGTRAELKGASGIKESFIMPPISSCKSSEDDKEELLTLNQLISSPWNTFFFGGTESGKTVLLFRLLREYVEKFDYVGKVPVFIDFDLIGNQSIKTCIREYLSCSTSTVNDLIDKDNLILLIDNLDYRTFDLNSDQFKRFHSFIRDNPKVQVVATADGGYSNALPIEYIENCKVPFAEYSIKFLRVKEIKSLMIQWAPEVDQLKVSNKLDKLINDFNSYALPSTAMSVSLFLWSTENSDRKPINKAVLLEIYIEIILEKLHPINVYREAFDFKNKLQLLAKIANEMLVARKENYSLTYSQYLEVVEVYLDDEVGFDFDAKVIADYFIERRIFNRFKTNRIKFSYSCFFHFFLGQRMVHNLEFREHVLAESEYYKYLPEINYYTGLTRSDKKTLELILARFKNVFSEVDEVFVDLDKSWDKHFIVTSKEEENFKPLVENIDINAIKMNRPSEESIDKLRDKKLASTQKSGEIYQKHEELSFEVLLILLANTLRNSEGVESKELKLDAYSTLIKYSMVWMILYRDELIRFIIRHRSLPNHIPIGTDIKKLLSNIPYHTQLGMSRHVGTSKLSPIILTKILEDLKGNSETNSDLEAFLSISLYSDIQGKEYPKYLKKLINKVKNNPVRDYLLYKLLEYYYRRTKEGSSNEEMYLDMIADLKIKTKQITVRMKHKFIKSMKEAKKKMLSMSN